MSPRFEAEGSGSPEPEAGLTPAPPLREDPDYSRLEEKISSLASAVSRWERELESSSSRSTRLEGAFTVLLSSLEGWKSDIREVASRTESRVLRGLEVIDSRISRVQPGQSPLDQTEVLAAIRKLERDISQLRAASGDDTLHQRLSSIDKKVSASDTELSGRLAASFEILERRLSSIEQRLSTPDSDLSTRITGSFDALVERLNAIELRLATPDAGLAGRIAASFEVLERRLQSIEQKVSASDDDLPARITAGLATLEQKFADGQHRLAEAIAKADPAQNAELLAQNFRTLEGRLSESQQVLTRKLEAARSESDVTSANQLRHLAALQEQQAAFSKRLEAVAEKAAQPAGTEQIERLVEGQQRLMEAIGASKESENLDTLAKSLAALETQVTSSHTALTSKLETVLAEGDENSATQLRYLGSLEELQASVAKRLHALEAVVKNPLDEQQWERLAKGLEFLDVRLAQSLDSVSSKLDTAIASLTSTLDARTASGQEANLKSAERLWRALRGLEDQITGSYQLVRQSQERLEAATGNVANALEELRAVHGARASHTEKIVMEGLENLDGRFAQNLMTVSERLSTAIFGLNKATEEWRSDLANSSEEAEERLTGRVSQAETNLARDLKTGLEALGRREERMLALILGGGAAVTPMPPEETPKDPE